MEINATDKIRDDFNKRFKNEAINSNKIILNIKNSRIINSNIKLSNEFKSNFKIDEYIKLNDTVMLFEIGLKHFFICERIITKEKEYLLVGYYSKSTINTSIYFCDLITEKNYKIAEEIIKKYLYKKEMNYTHVL